MGFLVDDNSLIICSLFPAGCQKGFFVQTHCSCGQVKDLGNRGSHGTLVCFLAARNVVRADSGLLVGRSCKGNHGFLTGHQMVDFYDITYCIDIRFGSPETGIDLNASTGI